MGPIFVSGLVNVETTVAVDGFPIEYVPVRYPFFGVRSTVSGVGLNIASALTALGRDVQLASIVGRDDEAARVRVDLERRELSADLILALVDQTATSAILYDPSGRRLINTDLKDLQNAAMPVELVRPTIESADAVVLCNINFSRPLLTFARELHKPVFTDVHALVDPDDDYNRDFMAAADVLFLSNEMFAGREQEFVGELQARFGPQVIVVGCGADGAMLFSRGSEPVHVPAVTPRPIVNTVGAGDALFAAFVDGYTRGLKAEAALRRAVAFAGWKIGAVGAAEGFADAATLDSLVDSDA